jgi:hypothetical protein
VSGSGATATDAILGFTVALDTTGSDGISDANKVAATSWPNVYWARQNTAGFHLVGQRSAWSGTFTYPNTGTGNGAETSVLVYVR